METGHWTSCSNDQMTTSPDEIGNLKELERLEVRMETGHWTLDFSYNKLTTICVMRLLK